MKLFLLELRKLLGNCKILLIIAAAIAVNIVFLVIPEYEDFSPAAYNLLWDKLKSLPQSERADFVYERIADNSDDSWFTGIGDAEFGDSFYEDQELLQYVRKEIAQTDSYSDYLKKVDASAENLKSISFFANENSFNYRNIIKTQQEFSALDASNVVSDKSKGVLMATKFGVSDILLLLLTLFFSVKLILSEREKGYFPLIRAAAKGKKELGAAKLFALIISELFTALLLYGSGIVTAEILYGMGDLSRTVQSVYGLFSCGDAISTGAFLIEFILVKLLFCTAFSAAVFMFSSLPLGSAAIFAIIFTFAGAETVLYYAIPATSIFAPLRQINLTAAADAAELVGKYLNVNFFGFPVKGAIVTAAATMIFAVICIVVGVVLFSGEVFEKRRSAKRGFLSGKNISLAANELYKSFIGGKAIFILIAAAVVAGVLQKPVKPYYGTTADYMYYSYILKMQGKYIDEKAEYIEGELEAAYLDFSERGEIKVEALERLKEHAEYLKEKGGYFLMDKGYQMLTGGDSVRTYDRLAAAVKVFVLILIASYSYTSECRSGAITLLRSSPKGRLQTFLHKLLAMVICSILILAIFDGIRIFNVLNTWGTDYFTAPARSMEHLSGISMPIVTFFILTEAGRLVGMIAVSAVMFFISEWVRNYSAVVISSSVFFVTPLVLSVMGFEFMDYYLFNPFLIGNVIG